MNILVSAGPTVEDIDDVRFISNRSTGRMGYAVAQAAVAAGHRVCLVSGPVQLPPPDGVDFVPARSADDMLTALRERFSWCNGLVMTAAVGDYMPVETIRGKRHKTDDNAEEWVLRLKRTPDILETLKPLKRPGQVVIGFSVDSGINPGLGAEKLARKGLDWIVVNDVSSFGSDTARFILLSSRGERDDIGPSAKSDLAARLLNIIETQVVVDG